MKREYVRLNVHSPGPIKRNWHLPNRDGSNLMCVAYYDGDFIANVAAVVVRTTPPRPLCTICARSLAKPVWIEKIRLYDNTAHDREP